MNTFGSKFRITVFGESHGPAIGVVMDGVPAGIDLCPDDFLHDIERRKPTVYGTTPRKESDRPEIVSGIFNGFTTGAPLAMVFRNENKISADYEKFRAHPRPSHADFAASVKYNHYNDTRGGGQFSGRLTLCLVAAGVVAKKMLGEKVTIESKILEIGGQTDSAAIDSALAAAVAEGDSLGGIIECAVKGIVAGVGEPFFDSIESVISHILFSIPAVKGVEFGSGFGSAALKGSENNDCIIDPSGITSTNNSGGINGGLTNGNPIVVRVAFKPTPSISKPQATFNFHTGKVEPLTIAGRHDSCIALRSGVIVEAAVAIALAQF